MASLRGLHLIVLGRAITLLRGVSSRLLSAVTVLLRWLLAILLVLRVSTRSAALLVAVTLRRLLLAVAGRRRSIGVGWLGLVGRVLRGRGLRRVACAIRVQRCGRGGHVAAGGVHRARVRCLGALLGVVRHRG